MNWSVALNALCSPEAPSVSWPDAQCRVVQLLGSYPERKKKSAQGETPRVRRKVAPISDEALIEALRSGRVTGPASVGLHFGMSRSSGHRHLARLAAEGRLVRVSWGYWRIVR